MPNPIPAVSPTDTVSSLPDSINALSDQRHWLGETALTQAASPYTVVATDELLVWTITADSNATLPDPATCVGRSLHVFVRTNGGHTLTLTPAAGTINGAGTLVLSTQWAGRRLVARATEWVAL